MAANDVIALSLDQCTEISPLSRRSLEYYAQQGLLKTHKVGARRIVLRRDLEKFLSADRPYASPAKAPSSKENDR